jgi:hypothetical protein
MSVEGSSIRSRLVHPRKAEHPMAVSEFGRVMFTNAVHASNRLLPIESKAVFLKDAVLKLVHPAKAPSPTLEMPGDTITSSSADPEKA